MSGKNWSTFLSVPYPAGGKLFVYVALYIFTYDQHGVGIYSKSEDPDPNYPAKKFNFPQICPKIAKKNCQKWPKMAQSGPNVTQDGPKWPKMSLEWPKMAQKWPKITQNRKLFRF